MRSKLSIMLLALVLVFIPGTALAAETTDYQGFLLAIDRAVDIPAGDTIGTIVAINHDATIHGTINDALIVINGNAVVTGKVDGDVNVVNGTLELRDGATVKNVFLYRSEMTRSAASTITGDVRERSAIVYSSEWAAFSFVLWVATTTALILAGLVFAAVGGRQLVKAGDLMVTGTPGTVLGAIGVLIGLPILAVAIAVTVVGIPFAIGLLLFLLPALFFLGYLVGGTRIGTAVLRALGMRSAATGDHPYLSVIVGMLLIQIIAYIPVFGGLIAFITALAGGGALAYLAWIGWRGAKPIAAGTAPVSAPTSAA
jgi:hypothetical protein